MGERSSCDASGDEPALASRGSFQPVEHGVEGSGQPAHLIVGAGLRHPPLPRADGHLGHLPAQGLDATQRPADHDPADQADDGEQDRQPDGEQAGDRTQAAVVLIQGSDDDHGAAVGADCHRDGHHLYVLGSPEGGGGIVQDRRVARNPQRLFLVQGAAHRDHLALEDHLDQA